MKHTLSLILTLFLLSSNAVADTTNWYKIEKLVVGTNGLHGTSITLAQTNFNGCPVTSAAFIAATDPNYDTIISLLLAARISGKQVRISYSGCAHNYPVIKEVHI